MIAITVNELKENLDKYIKLSEQEDVIVKEDGRVATMLTSPSLRESDLSSFLSLSGKYPYVDYRRLLDERDAHR